LLNRQKRLIAVILVFSFELSVQSNVVVTKIVSTHSISVFGIVCFFAEPTIIPIRTVLNGYQEYGQISDAINLPEIFPYFGKYQSVLRVSVCSRFEAVKYN